MGTKEEWEAEIKEWEEKRIGCRLYEPMEEKTCKIMRSSCSYYNCPFVYWLSAWS